MSPRSLLCACAISLCACSATEVERPGVAASPLAEAELDAVIASGLDEVHLPGLAACVVRGGAVAWCKGYGLADVEAGRPVTPDTPFLLASVSKVFTATALMQRWERGDLDLDEGIDRIAGLPIRSPGHASPITYRRLLAHVAGVADSSEMSRFYAYGEDPTISLQQVVEGYFLPGGAYYSARHNFVPGPPGSVHRYSNMGFALLGYLAQRDAGEDFAASTTATIFAPLGMKDTSWRLADFPAGDLAVPYHWTGHGYRPYQQYTFADYPNGALRSSARSVATFLAAQARGGELGGRRVLREATLKLMFEAAYPELDPHQGLGWYHRAIGGEDWVGHVGTESGVFTEVFLRPRDGLGFVVLTNGEPGAPVPAIEGALIAFGDRLPS